MSGWNNCPQSTLREDLLQHCQTLAAQMGFWKLQLDRVVEWTDTLNTYQAWVSQSGSHKHSRAIYYSEKLNGRLSYSIVIGPTEDVEAKHPGVSSTYRTYLLGHEFGHALMRSQRWFKGYNEGPASRVGKRDSMSYILEEGAAEIIASLTAPQLIRMQGIPYSQLGDYSSLLLNYRGLNHTYRWYRNAVNILFGLINQTVSYSDLYEATRMPSTFEIDIRHMTDLLTNSPTRLVRVIAEELAGAYGITLHDAEHLVRGFLELAKSKHNQLPEQKRFHSFVRLVEASGIRLTNDQLIDQQQAILEDQALAVA